MIEIKNIIKAYNKEVVLNIPELTISRGEIFGLVGNNGAGKTTLFNLVLDLIVASKGEIRNNGIVVSQSEDWKASTSAFIDESFLIGYLTAEEYLGFIGELRGLNKTDVEHFIAGICRLF
jgi:ABC-2 type transport system ATP-binding protein